MPTIFSVRPLPDAPLIHEVIAATFYGAFNADAADLIMTDDGREYVFAPADKEGFFFLEAIRARDGSYTLGRVAPDRANALLRASRAFQTHALTALAS